MIKKRIAVIRVTQEEAKEETSNVSYLECFRRSNLRRTMVSIMPMIIQALSGISFVGGYTTYYMQLAGFSTRLSYQLSIVGISVTIIGNIAAWFLVDRVGRRSLTFWGIVFVTIDMFLIGGLAVKGTTDGVKGLSFFRMRDTNSDLVY